MITTKNSLIAILGGAGKSGFPLVKETLKAGYQVRVLLRRPHEFDFHHERLEIVQGDVRDPVAVRQLLRGSEALLSTLGHAKGEMVPMMASATESYVTAMQELGIRRCVVVTSLFSTGSEQLDASTQQAADYMQTHYPAIMDDRRIEFNILLNSQLDWTYVRVPFIVQNPATGGVNVNLNHLPAQQITAIDLACFLIAQLDDEQYVKEAPFVASLAEQ